MRVTNIAVKHLFDIFDHSIALNLEQGMTIIHGSNGLGKTTLLRMVKSVLNCRLSELRTIPFAELSLKFDDNTEVVVQKIRNDVKPSAKSKRLNFQVLYRVNGVEQDKFEAALNATRDLIDQAASFIDRRVTGVSRAGPDSWFIQEDHEIVSSEELAIRYADMLPAELRESTGPEWFKRLSTTIHVRLIETQRLVQPKGSQTRRFEGERSYSQVVSLHSNELVKLTQERFGQYAALSQSLDRSFPKRLVQQKSKTSLSDQQLRERFRDLDTKRVRLEQAGLLYGETERFEIPPEMDDATRGVLSVYVEDVENKLSVFDDLAAKIDLFRQIINERFSYKKIRINQAEGFSFTSTRTGEELPSTSLSSGEQHEIVLLYELLFKVSKNSLIMIDEPEISLHIAWQEQFLDDIKGILKLSHFDVIIATHSPQIVNDRWNLTIGLSGPEDAGL